MRGWWNFGRKKKRFYTVSNGLSWFNIVEEWLKAHTVNMITTGLYKICTQILIRSINSVNAVSDKLGHSRKASLLARGGFTLRRNTHSCCCWDKREERGMLCVWECVCDREGGGVGTGRQIVVVLVTKANFFGMWYFWVCRESVLWVQNQQGFFLHLLSDIC